MILAKRHIQAHTTLIVLIFFQLLLGFSFLTKAETPRCSHRGSLIDMTLELPDEEVENLLKEPLAAETRCKAILRKIWEKQGGGEMPNIKIEAIEEYGKPAEYDNKLKTIIIDPKAYSLCLNMPQYGEDALAFLIAHEYVHAYQHQSLNYASPGFFVETKTLKDWAQGQRDRRRIMESQADIQGAILCYLCGYEVKDMIPSFIGDLYETFQLRDADPLYDSKNERMEIAYRAKESVEQYILQYDMANYLSILQHHDKDTVIYNYLIENFRSAEFYNNLGLSYVLQALPTVDAPFKNCPYPFMLDTETRLEDVTTKNQLSAIQLLKKGIENFDQTLAMNEDYLAMRINRACAYHILGSLETENKRRYLQKAEEDLTFVKRYREGIYAGRVEELQRLKDNAHKVSAIIAYPSMCQEKESRLYRSTNAESRYTFPWKVDNVDLLNLARGRESVAYNWRTSLSFAQNITLEGTYLDFSDVIIYRNPAANQTFFLQKVTDQIPGLPKPIYQVGSIIPESAQGQFRKSLPTLQGDVFFIHDSLGVIYKTDADGKVKEWARFVGN